MSFVHMKMIKCYTSRMNDTLPNRLRALRKSKSLTQAQLAKLAGIDQSHISRFEGGEKGVSTDVLRAISGALDVTLSDLVGDALDQTRKEYASDHPAREILSDHGAPSGLRELAGDKSLVDALRITEAEWLTLRSIDLPKGISKDGYVQLLITVRAISPT